MTVQISGIDTSNSDILMWYLNATSQSYPSYQQTEIIIVDANTLQIILS